MTIYIDEAAESLDPATSHPRFVSLAPPTFYSATDDFAPFGSDDGNDAFRDMEAWYEQRHDAADPSEFLSELLAGWGYELPADVLDLSNSQLLALVAENETHEPRLIAVARACIATAVGQLKIEGVVAPSMQRAGRTGVRILRCLHGDTTRYPDWSHRANALAGLDAVEVMLDAVQEANLPRP